MDWPEIKTVLELLNFEWIGLKLKLCLNYLILNGLVELQIVLELLNLECAV